jgi:ATP-binding cassette subfamily B protein
VRLLLRRFFPYLRPYAHLVTLSLLASLLGLGASSQIPQVLQRVIDGPVTHRQPSQLPLLAAALVGLGIAEFAFAFGRRQFINVGGFNMERDIRNDLYAHLQSLHVGFHDQWQSGQLLSRAIGDINTVRRFVAFGLVFLVQLGATFIVAVFFMVRIDAPLAAITAAAAIPVVILSDRYHRAYHVVARRTQDQLGDVATLVEEAATGVRIVKAFGRGQLLIDRFDAIARKLQDTTFEGVRLRAGMWTPLSQVPNANVLLVVLIGGLAAITGHLSVGQVIEFISYVQMLVWPVEGLGWILSMYEEATSAGERLEEVLAVRPEIADAPRARASWPGPGRLRFEAVDFAYPGSARTILSGLDLELEPGETVALVGRTGCGKTTLANLVPRLYDVTAGAITIDGVDIREFSLAALRGGIGVAFEDPILFSASVRENLLMGRPEAGEEDLEWALGVAEARFVYDLPWGLDTRIGEQGMSLSGGQRQRLALARAVLGRPHVLVLDDPLSAVDVHTEETIEKALHGVLHGVTALLVAHRPSTLVLADRVALLDGGRVAAIGTHRDLLHSNELYRELLSSEDVRDAEEVGA